MFYKYGVPTGQIAFTSIERYALSKHLSVGKMYFIRELSRLPYLTNSNLEGAKLNTRKYKDSTQTINKIEITTNTLTSRGGLAFISHYLEQIKFYRLLQKNVRGLHLGKKAVSFIIRQIIFFFIDGTHKAISGFDSIKKDDGYAAVLEITPDRLLSSHSIKRFFQKFTYFKCEVLRKVLNALFIWRLCVKQPSVIILDIDTMVLNNDDAKKRHGVDVTYKKVKGFQPLQITWGTILVDAIFRRGTAHSNHGTDVQKSLKRVVSLIRKYYRKNVPIILTGDSGFLDEKNLHYFNRSLGIFFICFGKLYNDSKEYVSKVPFENYKEYCKGKMIWYYLEFGNKLKSWKKLGFLRTIFTKDLCDEDGQMILDIARPDSVLYTNIGSNQRLTNALKDSGHGDFISAEKIIETAHMRGCNELINRSLKDLMLSEKLPFKRFGMNTAYYYFMVISHTLLECYKEDVVVQAAIQTICTTCYPSTFRRQLIDFACQIVSSGNQIILQLMQGTYQNIHAEKLWQLCNSKNLIPVPL